MSKKKILIISLCVTAAIVAGALLANGQGVKAEMLAVTKGEIQQYVEDTATVECQNTQTVYIEGSGKITEIYFDTGDAVNAGDLLLSLDTSDSELQLKNASSQVAAAESQVTGTQINNYSNQIGIASAALEQAKIARDSAERNFNTSQSLFDAGMISTEEYNKVKENHQSAINSYKAAELGLLEAQKGSPEYVKKGYSSQLEQALVLRDTILKNIDRQKLISPISGEILENLIEENSILTPGAPAFIIGDTSILKLNAYILSDESYKISLGDKVEIRGKYLGDNVAFGKVSKIAPSAKTVTSNLGVNQKRVAVTIDITGDYGLLKPGYNTDIKIITDEIANTITVPDSAVFDYKGSSCVFVVDNGKAVIRQVEKGLEGSKSIEITQGLNEGEVILIKPDNNIKEGIKISPVK
ncbi:multidrug export protein EmrA [Oxobacter pfennigii]|uniref:Multidrug export protein EmrA n=1 Tax=Oxobacter pfennigii TaxID=36849 RepID=A0A0P8X3X7_9CLOT|nr:efflux RND transporter periplasmic adaptor subunit [Oxobacter pfennigii]KPU45508.1 multidrug export protein EmrA [Oxobacter pfennigii]